MNLSKGKLAELIDRIDWIQIEPQMRRDRLPADKIAVGFSPSKKGGKVDEIRIRFGTGVQEHMGWHPGDKLMIANHPEDRNLFMVFKPESGVGWTLSQESKSPVARLHVRLDLGIDFDFKRSQPTDFQIHKKKIIVFKAVEDRKFGYEDEDEDE